MGEHEFKSMMLGSFQIEPEFQKAFEIWSRYYESTEAFDRRVCHVRSPRTGNAIPIDRYQIRACSANALERHNIAKRELDEAGIARDVSERAKRAALDMAERR
jgi:hypothetical protein